MRKLIVEDILKVMNGELLNGDKDLICENFSKDTRNINLGDVYIGIKGESFDGNAFWKQAFENGASCVIVSNVHISQGEIEKFADKTIIQVEDSLQALYSIAKLKRSFYEIPVIAITGSVGKTSTKDIIASVVSKKYKTLKTQGNNNNNIGLPFTILKLKDEEALVLEMGMNHLGEISLLSDIAKPDICIITNVGTSHIGNLGSRENILKAKLEILDGTRNPIVILNNDNDMLYKWYEENKGKYNVHTYGNENISDLNSKNIVLDKSSSKFECNVDGENLEIKVPVGGIHFVLNSLCAISVGKVLKMDKKDIISGIEEFELTEKRMDILELKNNIKIINDTYNASLESMKASLEYLTTFKENRKIAVLGDMFELGQYSEKLHEAVGKFVAEKEIDMLICNGENSKKIVDSAIENGMDSEKVYHFEDKSEIVNLISEVTVYGDIILFKASNGMKFFDLVEDFKNILI